MNEKSRIQVRDGSGELPWEDVGHDTTHQKVPVTLYDEYGVAVPNANYAVIVDPDTTVDVTYVGTAEIGSGQTSAVWRVFQVDKSTGAQVITWADGNDNFDNKWSLRATLSYS